MKQILKSLINNNACIEGGRKRKWWIAPILLLSSLILAIIPTLVLGLTTKGSGILSSNTYGVDYAMQYVLDQNEVTMRIVDGKLSVTGFETAWEYKANGEDKVDAKIYFIVDCTTSTFQSVRGSRTSTTIIFSETSFYIDVVNPISSSAVSYRLCPNAYKNFEEGTDIKAYLKGTTVVETRNNLMSFLDEVYDYERVVETWYSVGLFSAVNVVVVFLMGFLIWVLTRGKQNPFRMYTFFDGQKIAYWAALAPAVLAVPLGFIISAYSTMWFPMLLGIRVMWLTMKSLRPDGSGYEEQAPVKTVNVK